MSYSTRRWDHEESSCGITNSLRSAARTRTLNNWTRTSCVANYTTPEGLGNLIRVRSLTATGQWNLRSRRRPRTESPVANEAANADFQGLFQVITPERMVDGG